MSPKGTLNSIWGDAGVFSNPESTRPLIILRFYAVAALLLTSVVLYFAKLDISYIPVLIIALSVLLYNFLFLFIIQKKVEFQGFLVLQVTTDWMALFFVALYTGGIVSPAIYVFPVYSAIAGFLLSSRASLILTGFGSFLILVIFANDVSTGHISSKGLIYHIGASLIYITVLFMITLLSIWISDFMRKKIVTIDVLKNKIAIDNERLRKSHELSINMNADLSLDHTLKAITKTISESPRITACVIRLLSEDGENIEIRDTSGVSEEHAARGSVKLADCPIDLEAISTKKPVYIPNVLLCDRFTYKEDARAEGLVSMISIPLISRDNPVGVIRCYTNYEHVFSENDLKFLNTVATSSALSVANSQQFQKLEKLNNTRSAFLRLATHELRAPMAAVQSILRLVLDGFAGKTTKKQRELFERANKRIDRLLQLVSELLELEGFSEKNMEFEMVNLHELLSEVVADIAPKSDAKGIKMRVHIPRGDIQIECDHDAIYRVIENLIDNAVKYTISKGVVMVIVDEQNDKISIEIIDNGIGISEDDQKNLFKEFFRSKNARKIEVNGTGLGLSICKKIVESHKGTICVSSKLGGGTRFKVELPINQGKQQG